MIRSGVLLTCLSMMSWMAGRSQMTGGDMADLVQSNAARVFQVAHFSVPVFLADVDVDESLPGEGIKISRKGLERILHDSAAGSAGLIIQFLVAHELAHQLQFAHYRGNMINTTSCELRRLYECQADVLAGVYVSGLYDLPDSVAINAKLTPFMLRALEYVYSIGDEEYSRIFHPSFTERRMAFRLGLAYPAVRAGFRNGANTYSGEAIDYRPGEDSLAWSLRLSRAIIHYPNSVNKRIFFSSLAGTADSSDFITWHKTLKDPSVSYKLGYFKNANPFPVNLFLQCGLRGTYRDSTRQDPKYAVLQGKVKNYSYHLVPGDSVLVSGVLNWYGLSDSAFWPHFVSPPNLESLYTAEPSDGRSEEIDADCPSIPFHGETSRMKMNTLAYELGIALRASINKFKNLEVGFGQNFGSIHYTTNLNYYTDAEVWNDLSDSTAYLTIPLYVGIDSTTAREAFDKGASALLLLATDPKFKVKDNYWLVYDEGPDSSNSYFISKHTIRHIVNDNILITDDISGESRKMEGTDQTTNANIQLEYVFHNRGRLVRYEVKLTVNAP